MAEYENPQEGGREGHLPITSNTLLELHRLLALFLASKSFAALCTNYPGEGFDPIYKIQEVEEDEITRLLLYLAITARVINDREDSVFELSGSNCGQLEKNGRDKDIEILDLREACNKIIHAKKVRFDVEKDGEQTYLNPFIYLYGEQNGKSWKATLDIVAFSKEYVSLVYEYF